jgi:opine dehydrogenase
MLGIPTPTIDIIIELGSVLHGRDYRAEGRTVERLGLAGLSIKEIHNLVFDPDAGGAI